MTLPVPHSHVFSSRRASACLADVHPIMNGTTSPCTPPRPGVHLGFPAWVVSFPPYPSQRRFIGSPMMVPASSCLCGSGPSLPGFCAACHRVLQSLILHGPSYSPTRETNSSAVAACHLFCCPAHFTSVYLLRHDPCIFRFHLKCVLQNRCPVVRLNANLLRVFLVLCPIPRGVFGRGISISITFPVRESCSVCL